MNHKTIFVLFSIQLAAITVGSSMGTLIPVFATRIGAGADQAGYLMSAAFIGMVGGFLTAGRFADRQAYRKPLLVAAGFLLVILFLLGTRIQTVRQLALFSVCLTFLDGMQIATVSVLAGLHVGKGSRGRAFGILGSAGTLGTLAAGLSGSVVEHWGFAGLFAAAALITLLKPLLALLIDDRAVETPQRGESDHPQVRIRHSDLLKNRAFLLPFLASVIAFTTGGVYSLGRSLGMMQMGFDTAAISSTVAVGGLITLPFPLLIGWLSDRIGRRPLLALCYSAGAGSLLVLAFSTQLWHIWAASAFHALLSASLGIGSAMVTDLVPRKTIGSALSLFGTTSWLGMIIGYSLTGAAIQRLGLTPTLISGIFLALVAVSLVAPTIRQAIQPALPSTSSSENLA